MEHYGVLGIGVAPKKVINASLNDIGTKVTYLIPWYGQNPIPSGLEVVYDWMLDNEASYKIIAATGAKAVPKILARGAGEVVEADDVDLTIIKELKQLHGLSTILWSDEDEAYSVNIASTSINIGLPTLELTNGLTPIILESDTPAVIEVKAEKVEDDMEELDISSFDRETLEVMPAAHVKRLARNAGYEVKTKDEAINALISSKDSSVPVVTEVGIASIVVKFHNGDEISYTVDSALLNKIHGVVVAEHLNS
jgi:hypothetical protein